LGKIVINDRKLEVEDEYKKVVVEICWRDFKSPHKAPFMRQYHRGC
jgi:hypothetical protein